MLHNSIQLILTVCFYINIKYMKGDTSRYFKSLHPTLKVPLIGKKAFRKSVRGQTSTVEVGINRKKMWVEKINTDCK